MTFNILLQGIILMTEQRPERVDKIQYYRELPLAHLLKEASCAEVILKNSNSISSEKLSDSKLIVDELNRRIVNS